MWMIEREENSITAIITDPPYGVKEYTEDEKTEKAIYWTQGTFKDKLPNLKHKLLKKII